MDYLLEALDSASAPDRECYRPEFFRLTDPADRIRLEDLLKREPRTLVHDELHGQLIELIRTLDPSERFSKAGLEAAVSAHLDGRDPVTYGVWVHYPWSGRLVHLLDETEFVLVRTDRNRNKITAHEQKVLSTKRIGVIGLSVGQSVCLTLALERSFGELRIADHDTLDLSNLNRIRSGVHGMGCLKTVNVAREIAELDPFLKVTLYSEGITAGNLERFCTEGGKLDVLVDECDSVDVKIQCRLKARELGIPVVMDTSDRGMLDVERFDREPGRSILHGLIDHLDLADAVKARTNEEKLPFVLPIAGIETLSPRMKASMLEIENSVTTWPQLASSVVMGGGSVGHIVRRINLGHPVPSGRWWLDPDDLIGLADQDPRSMTASVSQLSEFTPTDRPWPEQFEEAITGMPPLEKALRLSRSEAEALAAAGSMAPSGGNCQPWVFLYHGGRLFLFLNGQRARSALDPGYRYAFLGMGACLENMLLQGGRQGLVLRHSFLPRPEIPQLVGILEVVERGGAEALDPIGHRLAGEIERRCTNRKQSTTSELTAVEIEALTQAIGSGPSGPTLIVVTGEDRIARIAELCGRAERIRALNPTCHHDMFVREMRWNKEAAETSRDGIDVATLELSLADRTGLRVASDPKTMSLLKQWGAGKAVEKMTSRSIRNSSGLAIISLPDLDLERAFLAGRGMERFWLQASALELLAHPVGAPIFMGLHGRWDRNGILSPDEHREADRILGELTELLGLQDRIPFFMLRLGRAGAPSARSLRLPLNEVFRTLEHIPA